MPLGSDLAKAANSAPTETICHRAVVAWLVKANGISGADQARIGGTAANAWGTVLAAYTDTTYTKDDLGDAPAGTVIGYFDQRQMLQHSMVAMGGGVIAGVNNAGVIKASVAEKVGIRYARVTVDQLEWVDNSRVGINQCVVRGVAPETVVTRIAG